MYSIPIIINNRRERISELFLPSQHNASPAFVVETNKTAFFNVFAIEENAVLKTFIENTCDIPFSQLKSHCSFDAASNKIIIALEKNEIVKETIETNTTAKKSFYDDIIASQQKPIEPVIANTATTIELDNISKDILFQYTSSASGFYLKAKVRQNITTTLFDIDNINIAVQFIDGAQIYIAQHTIHIAHPTQFLAMALDFGSEASQMVVTRYSAQNLTQEDQPSNENLFKNIQLFHSYKKWIDASQTQFYQEEKNTPFYKSIFFLKGSLEGHYTNFQKMHYIENQNDNLKMLVDKGGSTHLTEAHFKQLPNLKITHNQDNILSNIHFQYQDPATNYPIDIKLNQISSKLSNTILKTMIESFLKKEMVMHQEGKRMVRLTLLVPNIYDSHAVQMAQKNIHQIFADLALQEDFKDRLIAWEVLTISESDSAFIGYMSKTNTNVQANKEYIIIDAGKGTTDFSIIKTGAQNVFEVKPIYRNGFAGAGNLITNALFETLIHFIRERNKNNNGVHQFIQENIFNELENDLAKRNELFAELERLKFHFSKDKNYKNQWINARIGAIGFDNITQQGVDLSTITNLLKSIDKIADFYGYVNDVCEMISEKTIVHLEMVKNNFSSISFAGAVLTGRGFLFEPLAEKMKAKLNTRLNINTTSIDLLKGNELKDVCIKGVFNKSIRINSEVIGYPIQKIKTTIAQPITKQNNTDTKTKTAWWKKLFGSIDDFENFKHQFVVDNKLDFTALQNSEIIIGSNSYSITDQDIFSNANTAKFTSTIDYKSDGYKVRRNVNGIIDQVVDLHRIPIIDNPDLHMIVPSLFPNYIDEKYLDSTRVEFDINTPEASPVASSNNIEQAINNTTTINNDLLFGNASSTTNEASKTTITRRDDLIF